MPKLHAADSHGFHGWSLSQLRAKLIPQLCGDDSCSRMRSKPRPHTSLWHQKHRPCVSLCPSSEEVVVDSNTAQAPNFRSMYAPASNGPQPIPGMKIKPPAHNPGPNAVVTGYETCQPNVGCCECDTLSSSGLIWVIGLALFAAPFCFIPCCMDSCHETYQRPIYGQAQSNAQMPQQSQYPQGGQYPQGDQYNQSQYPPPGQYRDEPATGVPTKQF